METGEGTMSDTISWRKSRWWFDLTTYKYILIVNKNKIAWRSDLDQLTIREMKALDVWYESNREDIPQELAETCRHNKYLLGKWG